MREVSRSDRFRCKHADAMRKVERVMGGTEVSAGGFSLRCAVLLATASFLWLEPVVAHGAANGEHPPVKREIFSCDDAERWKSAGLGPWQESYYVLPYAVGEVLIVNQANCSGFGHSSFWSFGYDFVMPIGTVVRAARRGVVSFAKDGAVDGDREQTNFVTVSHSDGTVAVYSHLTLNGVLVTKGQQIETGDIIGKSGDTGNTGGLPHLHFSVHVCGELPGVPGDRGLETCPSTPVNFRNTRANPAGLVAKEAYEAMAHRCAN